MIRKITIIAILHIFIITINAQDYYFRKYGAEIGAPTTLVAGIQEDSLGKLWVGYANKGLYQFDGYEFELIKNLNSGIIEIYKNNNNEILIGASHRTLKYSNDSLQSLYNINQFMRSYVQLDNGDECFGTENGEFLLYKNGIKHQTYQKSNRRIGQIAKDKDNTAWFISEPNTISSFANGIITNYNFSKKASEQIWSVCVDDQNNVFASSLNSIKILKNGEFIDWQYSNKLLKPFANYIFNDSRGRLWFLHIDGVTIYDHGKFQYLKEDNFKGMALVTVYEDRNNIFWFGTTKGLVSLQNENCMLNPFSLKAEFMLSTIFQDSENRIWTGSVMDGLLNFKKGKVSTVLLPIKENLDFYHFFEDQQHKIWISTSNGVFILNNNIIKHLLRGKQVPNDPVYSITQDNKGKMWGSTPNGVFQINTNSFTYFNESLLLDSVQNHSDLFEVFADSDGEIWVLSDQNLLKWNSKEFISIIIKSEKFRGRKWGMVESPKGSFWLATHNKGIINFNQHQNTINYYGTKQGVISNTIISITKDKEGNIVAGSFEGLNKLELDTNGKVKQILTYNKENGLIDDECLYKVLLCDNDNNIWFGSAMGLIKFKEPNWENLNYTIPTYIEVNHQKSKTHSNTINLKYSNNQFTVKSTGIHLANPSAIRYSYWLEGHDTAYSSPGSKRNITFSNLRPGTYTLHVKTSLIENKNWYGENQFHINISAPLYFHWWFISILLVVVTLLFFMILKFWAQNIKQKQIKKEENKRKVLELELKFLRSQMNPHFMFNSINSIQNLILNESIDQALNYLNDFGRLIRRVLNYSEKSTVTIKEELDFLNEYLGLEKLRFKDKIDIKIGVDEKLDLAFDRIPPMLIQPFIENAIKHGLLPKNGNGWISITFKPFGENVLITVLDNGVGRKYHENIKKLNQHQSKGTQIIEDRIDLLKQKALSEKEYSVEIIDLYNKNNLAIGTKVIIKIPLY